MFKIKVRHHGAAHKEFVLVDDKDYTIGRGSTCDLILEESSGISRQHIRLYQENGEWRLQVISKFGKVNLNGEMVSDALLTPDSIFKLPPYDFFFVVAEDSQPRVEMVSRAEEVVTEPEPEMVEENEHTMVGRIESVPYLRLTNEAEENEELFRLEGTNWIAGRDESCAIFLNHSTASRRQFRIETKQNAFFITDLGSSNGTSLNGKVLPKNETVPLRSGDVITLRGLKLQFEMRDPNFKNKLTQIPEEMLAPLQLPAIATSAQWGVTAPNDRGGVIRLDQNAGSYPAPSNWPANIQTASAKRKKFMLIAVGAIVLFLAFIFSGSNSKPKVKALPQQSQAFDKLTAAQKQLVKDSYNLAKNLHLQGKFELAAEQLKKLHELMPEGYLDSRKLAEDCSEASKYQQRVEELRQEKERIENIRKKVASILFKCDAVSRSASSVDEIKNCLSEAVELDPENGQINTLVERVTRRIEDSKVKSAERAEYSAKLQKARSLYAKAQSLQTSGDLLAAISAYEKFLAAGLPDPGNLKFEAQKTLTTLRSSIATEAQKRISSAEVFHKAGNLKDALGEIDKAKKVDPSNLQANEMGRSIQRELNGQLQEIYSNSVLDEGLGNIEAAKEKWRKIIEVDRIEGDYYRRAKNKLRTYGAL